jgi:probable rRNA maturation factor
VDPDSSRGRPLLIAITDGRGRAVRAPGLANWLRRVSPASAQGELSIALVPDRVVRTFNRRYRGKDHPTDVLSFGSPRAPRTEPRTPRSSLLAPRPSHPPLSTRHLGDLVIATGIARRQAREAGHSYATELKVLALHGLLHLLGYDHHDPAGRGRMARVERALRRKGGLRAGLIERARVGRRR